MQTVRDVVNVLVPGRMELNDPLVRLEKKVLDQTHIVPGRHPSVKRSDRDVFPSSAPRPDDRRLRVPGLVISWESNDSVSAVEVRLQNSQLLTWFDCLDFVIPYKSSEPIRPSRRRP